MCKVCSQASPLTAPNPPPKKTLLKQDKQEGTLSEEEIGQYELCCLSVAKQHMKDKKFNDAISLLKEVSSKSTYSKQAKDLLKKAKRGQSK